MDIDQPPEKSSHRKILAIRKKVDHLQSNLIARVEELETVYLEFIVVIRRSDCEFHENLLEQLLWEKETFDNFPKQLKDAPGKENFIEIFESILKFLEEIEKPRTRLSEEITDRKNILQSQNSEWQRSPNYDFDVRSVHSDVMYTFDKRSSMMGFDNRERETLRIILKEFLDEYKSRQIEKELSFSEVMSSNFNPKEKTDGGSLGKPGTLKKLESTEKEHVEAFLREPVSLKGDQEITFEQNSLLKNCEDEVGSADIDTFMERAEKCLLGYENLQEICTNGQKRLDRLIQKKQNDSLKEIEANVTSLVELVKEMKLGFSEESDPELPKSEDSIITTLESSVECSEKIMKNLRYEKKMDQRPKKAPPFKLTEIQSKMEGWRFKLDERN
ncbi:unnamed protein product [Caenorhabditis auriculariae]|uniref:Uncharacterized protein n=1 Tax=Caenorhabditis auriculariae TaxID=2777116 RepID=A0A8S1HWJ5_9PELO|nr:unnamed protein product [Caenorhabditis auriculariae]